jgi:hypothetical protein
VNTKPGSFLNSIRFQHDLQQHAPLRQCCSSLSNPQGSPTCTIHPVTMSMMTSTLLLLRRHTKQPSLSKYTFSSRVYQAPHFTALSATCDSCYLLACASPTPPVVFLCTSGASLVFKRNLLASANVSLRSIWRFSL